MDIIKSGATWVICTSPILDVDGARLNGLADIAYSISRYSGGVWQWLDADDNTFRAAPGTHRVAMSAVDATKRPGVYFAVIDWSAVTNIAFGDQLFVDVLQTTLTNAANANQDGSAFYGLLVDKVETNLNATVGSRAAPGDPMALVNDAITAAKIAAGAIGPSAAPLLANLDVASSTLATVIALANVQADLTAMKGAGFDGATDSMRAIRVLISALPTAASIWATAYGTPDVNTFGWLLYRLGQWGTEICQKRIVGQNLLLQSIGGATTYASVPLKDISDGAVAPAVGEPAQFLP